MSVSPALLEVEASATGKRWEARCEDGRAAMMFAQRLQIPQSLAAVLVARGIDLKAAPGFLDPRLAALMPSPSTLQGLDAAVELLIEAIEGKWQVARFGDYDVDGVSSVALMVRALSALGLKPLTHIPNRITEGYGPNLPALKALHSKGAKLVIMLDCGTTSFDVLEQAKTLGLKLVVIDHHQAEPRLLAVDAIVNPNRLDDESGLGSLCAAGVVFMVLVGLFRALRTQGYQELPDLRSVLDLVALATVCDVVALRGLNRAFVAQGLKVMSSWQNKGLKALFQLSKLSERPSAGALGFHLGPRINAGGRVALASAGLELLVCEDQAQAMQLAQRLDILNQERQAIEKDVLEQALEEAEQQSGEGRFILASGEGWHEGVIGIVAGRLKERFYRPAFILSLNGESAKGSARSIPGVDIGALVTAARQAGLLLSGGGHAMAAGLSMTRANIPDFIAFLKERLKDLKDEALCPRLGIDSVLALKGVNFVLYKQLQRAAPFGQGNPEPRLVIRRCFVENLRAVGAGQDHYALRLGDGERAKLKAIAFRCAGEPLGQALQAAQKGRAYSLAGHLRDDPWAGPEAVQFIVEDAAPCH